VETVREPDSQQKEFSIPACSPQRAITSVNFFAKIARTKKSLISFVISGQPEEIDIQRSAPPKPLRGIRLRCPTLVADPK
tara:strand:- start:331 stop:570 length:240 start_codon:yes stop_codon:yes gene_type:complete